MGQPNRETIVPRRGVDTRKLVVTATQVVIIFLALILGVRPSSPFHQWRRAAAQERAQQTDALARWEQLVAGPLLGTKESTSAITRKSWYIRA